MIHQLKKVVKYNIAYPHCNCNHLHERNKLPSIIFHCKLWLTIRMLPKFPAISCWPADLTGSQQATMGNSGLTYYVPSRRQVWLRGEGYKVITLRINHV